MQYFAPQLQGEQRSTHSLRASKYRKKRKNRHGNDGSGGDDSDSERDGDKDSYSSGSDVDLKSRLSQPNAHSYPSFASSELAQLRVAGLLPGEEYRIPPSPFPHAPARTSRPYLGTAKIQKELARPPSRLFTIDNTIAKGDQSSSQVETSNLRRRHLNVLSTVMHRCLLEGDYNRAGRAWGMILRTHATGGNLVDLRNHGRWAIGAEILLRRRPHGTSGNPPGRQDGAANTDIDFFSKEGFELAREYYERLIVQHPTRKQAPHAVDQRSFYPAMFSLWIQEVYEKSKRARKLNEERKQRPRLRSMSIDSGDEESTEARILEDAIQSEELAQATEIAERLDDLVKSPPFDKQASLLQLRGTIALWISDLIVGNTVATVVDEWDAYPIRKNIPAPEQITKFHNCQRELQTARNYLVRAEENEGPRQYHTLLKIENRLEELQKQTATLQSGGEDDTGISMEEDW